MEAMDYFHGGYYRSTTPQYTPEKQGSIGGGDHFIVEDLLDFSNEEEEAGEGLAGGAFDAGAASLTESSTVTTVDSCSNSSGPDQHFSGAGVNVSGEICEPYDELAELEWLSNFVEESFSSEDLEKLQLISGLKPSSSSSSAITDKPPLFPPEAPVPGKARSKRSRAAPCNWSSRLLLLSRSPEMEAITVPPPIFGGKKLPKPAKKREPSDGAGAGSDGRRCLHCATDKTPQWRTGPMGPKTLCNACGVRFKSGRLVPEYRPASSPTFVMSKHSNSHRKVLELRRQNEMQDQRFLHHGAAVYGGGGITGDEFLIHHHVGPDFRQLI